MTMLWLRGSVAGTGSIPVQCVCLTKWHWYKLVTGYFAFVLSVSLDLPCQYHSTNAPYVFSTESCSFLRDKPAWERTKKEWSLGNRGALDRKLFDSLVSRRKMGSIGGVKLTLNINGRRVLLSLLL